MADVVDDTPASVGSRDVTTDGETEVINATGILRGGGLIRVSRAGRDDLYLQAYRIPNTGQFAYYQFDPTDSNGDGVPDVLAATYGDTAYGTLVMSEATFNSRDGNDLFYAGDAAGEIIGVAGNFEQLFVEVQRKALIAAGINDPGIQGKLLADPEYARLITRGAIAGEELTGTALTAEFRNLPIYQEIYPGINFFLERGDVNPEAAWRQYQSAVEPLARQLGYTADADGSYRSTIGDMLGNGVSAEELDAFTPTLLTIQQNPNLKPIMDEWAQKELGRPLDFNEFIDVLAGTTDPELNQVVEAATLAYAAQTAGLGISVDEIRKIAAATDMTAEEALAAFTNADKALLSIGESELAGFGVTKGDFLDVATNRAPRSGLSRATVLNLQDKLAAERGLSDEGDARFFLGFSDEGQAQRQGLNPLGGVGG